MERNKARGASRIILQNTASRGIITAYVFTVNSRLHAISSRDFCYLQYQHTENTKAGK